MKTSRSWVWLGLLSAAVMLTAGCTGGVARLSDPKPPSRGGPLEAPAPHQWRTTVTVGTPFTDGREVLHLNGDHRARIVYVLPVADAALKSEPAVVVGPGRLHNWVQRLPWPVPTDQFAQPVEPAKDAMITTWKQDRQGWELLVRMSASTPGHHVRHGFRIGYYVDGKLYEQYFPARIDVWAYATNAASKGSRGISR